MLTNDITAIKRDHATGMTYRQLANKYTCSFRTISRILHDEHFKLTHERRGEFELNNPVILNSDLKCILREYANSIKNTEEGVSLNEIKDKITWRVCNHVKTIVNKTLHLT